MRWSYKTVHYEMKKEGLLGSAFLDESEVELSLNEYGKAGWELVSILEILDGLIAVFKQPLSFSGRSLHLQDEEEYEEKPAIPAKAERARGESRVEPRRPQERQVREEVYEEAVPIDDYEVIVEEPERKRTKASESKKDVGAIRIE